MGEDAVEQYNSFTFDQDEDRDDPEVLKQKFEELCMPLKNLTFKRHLFHTTKQRQSKLINSFVTDLKNIAKNVNSVTLSETLSKIILYAEFKVTR